MPQLPDHIGLRREQSRARWRRVRQRRAVALAGLLIVAVALVGASGGGSGAPPRVHHRRVSSISVPARAAVARPRRLSALEARGVATIRKLAALGLPVYCGGRRGNAVAFTFDDGPGVYTHYALKKLAEARERATFFAVGKSIDAFPGYLPRELEVAAIGDHTFTHSDLIALSAAQITSEIERTRGLIQRQTGQPVVLFRPPYGAHNSVVDGILKRLGLLEIMWSVDSADSLGANYAGIIRNVERGLHPGAIIELHENRGQTIRALTTLLPELHRRHLRSVSLPELFATDPPSAAQLRRGEGACASGSRLSSAGAE